MPLMLLCPEWQDLFGADRWALFQGFIFGAHHWCREGETGQNFMAFSSGIIKFDAVLASQCGVS